MELYYQTSDSVTLTIYINGVLADADTAPTITITRLADSDVIVNGLTAATVSTGKYRYTLTTDDNSVLGKYKVVWNYLVGGVGNNKTEYYDVVVGYANAQQVKDFFPSLATKTNDEIYAKEKLARKIINIYCNQDFGFELDTTKIFRGSDKNTLFLKERLWNLDSVEVDGEDDITTEVEVVDDYWIAPIFDARPGFFIDIKKGLEDPARYFRIPLKYHVTGDWGWEAVPDDINLACMMLINDYFCDDTMLRQHGILSYKIADRDMTFRRDLWGTTGNYDVDMLLSNYTFVDARLI